MKTKHSIWQLLPPSIRFDQTDKKKNENDPEDGHFRSSFPCLSSFLFSFGVSIKLSTVKTLWIHKLTVNPKPETLSSCANVRPTTDRISNERLFVYRKPISCVCPNEWSWNLPQSDKSLQTKNRWWVGIDKLMILDKTIITISWVKRFVFSSLHFLARMTCCFGRLKNVLPHEQRDESRKINVLSLRVIRLETEVERKSAERRESRKKNEKIKMKNISNYTWLIMYQSDKWQTFLSLSLLLLLVCSVKASRIGLFSDY